LRPGDTIVTDGATIKGAKAYASGDFVLTNVHTINDYTGFDGDFGMRFGGDANKEQAASTVAPDGTVYLLTVCEAKPEEKINMQGLFKMTEEGWVEICRFEQKVEVYEYVINNNGDKFADLSVSRSFVFCDAESNPVVFLYDYEDEKLVAYSCDVTTGQTEAVAEVPVTVSLMSGAYVNITACADGENIYFAAFNRENSEGTYVDILVYNLEGREFAKSSVLLYVDNMTFALNAIAHHNDRIYLLGADKSVQRLLLCAVKDFTKETPELVYEQWLYMGEFGSVIYDCASLYVDDAGTAYIFATNKEDSLVPSSTRHGLEIVSAEGEILFSKQYAPLDHIEEAMNCGIFMGPDKTLYFIECYESAKQITVGAIAEDYDKISESVSFKAGIANSGMLQAQFISDPTGKNGVFVDLLGKSEKNDGTVLRFGYMRLRLK
ncbi:MAG: hypothetical protein IKL89_02690, partial [Clostridia bacterium]|nr:hypothetical protein [Clostridia bacterium]